MATRLNKETVEELASKGSTIRDIATSLGASYSGVFNFCKANHIDVRKAGKLAVENVKQDIRDGLTQTGIGAKYDVTPASVSTFIKTNGLKDLYVSFKAARPKRTHRSKVKEATVIQTVEPKADSEHPIETETVAAKQEWVTAD